MFKSVTAIAALSAASLAFASSASAHNIVPLNTAYTGHGSFTVSLTLVSVQCTMHLKGSTHGAGDAASITAVQYSGLLCGLLKADGLPWTVAPTGVGTANIIGIGVDATVIGVCGPGTLGATDTPTSGVFAINGTLPGTILPCAVSSTYTTVPHLRIK